METKLLFEFIVDKEHSTIQAKREFAAAPERVWDAWTQSELLDQWWAPKPYQTKTKFMDFREGGHWLYAMANLEGEKSECHWCRNDYQKITPKISFSGWDAFCDEDGKVNPELPRTSWLIVFKEADGKTLVTITTHYDNQDDLEKIIAMGFQEGFSMALGNLDDLLLAKREGRP